MFKDFFYLSSNNEQKGPVSIDHLKSVGIKSDTLVWTEGLDNWKPAKEVEALKNLFVTASPPPLPPPLAQNGDNVQDSSVVMYKVHTTCAVFSIILGVFCWSIIFYIPNFNALIGFATVGIILGIAGIVTAKKAKGNIGLSIAGITISFVYLLAEGLMT